VTRRCLHLPTSITSFRVVWGPCMYAAGVICNLK